MCSKVQQFFGTGAHFFPLVKPEEHEQLEALLKSERIAAIFSEVPTNPLLRCVDYAKLHELLNRTQPRCRRW